LGTVNVPSTGGWQNWTTITQTVTVNAGTYNFGIFAQSGGWNINWFEITPVAPSTVIIQAENYSAMAGVKTEATTDAGGGLDVGYINAGSWMAYDNINFPSSGTYTVQYRVASLNGGQLSMDLNAGSIQLGAVNLPATGGWQNWTTVSQTVNVNAGTYNVGIYAQTGGWNINWFSITKVNNARTGSFDTAVPSTDDISSNYNLGNSVVIFPNPIEGELRFISGVDLGGGSAKIVDGLGIEVLNTSISSDKIDVSSLSAGIYTILINKDGNSFSKKFVKR
ncbi:MAG TPA: carbohydrate-binding protein, partial [Bacteroidia bacterium]|nr:carbohydrate-binding protein [Bacteroidia bacterium]